MSDLLEHNGYRGTVEYSNADKVLYGKLFGINDLVSYEGASVKELNTAFKEAVEDYIESCKKLGKEPEKAFKGSFNVRIKPELHKRAAFEAEVLGQSLNEFVEASISWRLEQNSSQPVHLSMVEEGRLSEPKPATKKRYDTRLSYTANEKKLVKRSEKKRK